VIHLPSVIRYTRRAENPKGRPTYQKGYATQDRDESNNHKNAGTIPDIKLLLDKRKREQTLIGENEQRVELQAAVKRAIDAGYIKHEDEVIEDFLAAVAEISRTEASQIDGHFQEVILTTGFALPMGWGVQAGQRVLQIASRALQRAGFSNRAASALQVRTEDQCSAEGVFNMQGNHLNVGLVLPSSRND
jgi:hypothetical protein